MTVNVAILNGRYLNDGQRKITYCQRKTTKKFVSLVVNVATARLPVNVWPKQRQAAILWILAHLVHYRL